MTPHTTIYFLDSIVLETNAVRSDFTQNIVVNDTNSFKLDTATQANIIPENVVRTFYTSPLQTAKP